MKLKKYIAIVLVLSFITLLMVGCIKSNTEVPAIQPDKPGVKIVATTSWTALVAEAAGAKDVKIIAPVELKHPPEYDFKPSDIQSIQEADWVIMAGYEPFMRKILESTSISEDKIIRITTTNTQEVLVEQTRIVAEKLGTQNLQQQWEQEFVKVMDTIKDKGKTKDIGNIKVLVHVHMSAFIKSLGYDVVGTFGAEELSPAKMGELANLKPSIIIDNYHNPQGAGIAELSKSERVELRNFPGPEHKTINDVIIDNAKKLGLY